MQQLHVWWDCRSLQWAFRCTVRMLPCAFQQMYERSQALAAHEQQQQEEGAHLAAGGRQHHQQVVTPSDLTSALSAALGQGQSLPQPPPPASQPSSTNPQSGAVITQDTLSSALTGAYRGNRGAPPPAQTEGAHPRGPTPGSAVPQSQRDQYRQQVGIGSRRVVPCLYWVLSSMCMSVWY